ncbi:nucleoside phosphorylase [Microbacterium aurantiacum]|uniref:Nucleoside phosphorylase n=1 Tax=Microbacterium aurantiacum TaxID=162393 RepID=A0A0M8MMN1_9MICO|nr:nucleoside phosphorylase [Microbacterium chocolatum]ANG84129.1 nucleoside phosphorylase [Microbacterium chocolatum]KOS10574.1 nucleoside phosphorylase [Microbacterium chocolatum]
MKLLVASLDAELSAFPDEIPGFDRLVTGPGKLQATYALTRALDAGDYDEVVVVGTAGAIDPRIDYGVYEISAAVQHDVTDIDGIVGQHVSLPPRLETAGGDAVIATGDHFVDDVEAVRVIRPLGAGLVDMETYAYIWVASHFDVPIRVFKAVSDRAQDDAITDWRTAVTACSAQLYTRLGEVYPV